MLKRPLALLLSAFLPLTATPHAQATAYDAHPKLVILLVIDQFRADYLQRYRSDFRGRGFRLFLDHGAYFPDCYYGYANTKTAPGHATLGTGAYSDGHGINANEWWDLSRNKQRPVSSVEDDRYTPVESPDISTTPGATPPTPQQEPATTNPTPAMPPAPATGTNQTPPPNAEGSMSRSDRSASPRNLLASTLGDELRLATVGNSRVYGVSLKDRAAILPAGAAANGAFWIDNTTGRFLTSSYYMPQLPPWVTNFNNGPAIQAATQAAAAATATAAAPTNAASASIPANFYNQVGPTNAANIYEIAFAEALITGEQLGSRATTDMLTLSLSPNDLEGHHVGPDSPEEHLMVDALDTDLDSFFSWLDTHVPGGLANVVIAFSADHGIAPLPAVSSALGLPGAYVDTPRLLADLNRAINAKFSPGENIEYLLPHQELPYLSLNRPAFERAGIIEQEAEDAVKAVMEPAFLSLATPASDMAKADPSKPGTANPPANTIASPTNAAGNTDAAKPATTATPGRTTTNATPGNASGKSLRPALIAPPPLSPVRPAPNPRLFRTFTRQQLAAGDVPPTEFGQLLAHSYSPNGGWYVAVIPVAFQMEGSAAAGGTTHFSPFSYDRHVPLGFYGAPFLPGTYRGRVEPVDLASTLASILGVTQPSAAVGHVLTQALRPAAEFVYPKEPVIPRHARTRRGVSRTDKSEAATSAIPSATAPAPLPPQAPPATPALAPPAPLGKPNP